ncbi:MAG: FtsX-like permease family protein, partial [Gemmata sp.]|nr:FtsX-like permease family protein [Gemmata sp.]
QGLRAEPSVIFVGDGLSDEARDSPYPVIAGLNPAARSPLGPFLPPGVDTLGDDDIVLLEWDGSDLNGLPPGTPIRLRYFDPEVEGAGVVKEATFTLRGYIRFPGPAQDRHLVPEIAGVTDARADLYNWDRPPVLPKETIRQRVPDKHPRSQFFNVHKATPMAYLTLATARRLFSSRYGADTSLRIAPAEGKSLEQTADELRGTLVQHLDPAANGFAFDPIRERLLAASRGGNDFGLLFLGFSCFLIVAALMLVGLLFRLSLERRAKEVGLLLATGFAVGSVRRLLLAEGLMVAVVGAAVGLVAAVAYNRLLLELLIHLWPDAEVRSYLQPHVSAESFAIGFIATVVMAGTALWWSLRGLVKVPPPALLRGETTVVTPSGHRPRRGMMVLAVVALASGLGLIAAGGTIDNPDLQALTFFSGGGMLLAVALMALWLWMNRTRHAVVNGRGLAALATLGRRNAARNPGRSLLTALMLGAAAFLLVAVESFRRQPDREFLNKTGGSGGYNLVAECDVPLFQAFDSGPGRADLERQLQRAFAPPEADPAAPPPTAAFHAAQEQLAAIEEVLPLRVRSGDDASCANLFQATRPRILGIPDAFLHGEKRFKFYAARATSDDEKANPWRLLLAHPAPDEIPVICEQNTAQWMLKKAVGDTFVMPGDDGRDLTFRIVATLVDSPFQSELIISDSHFARVFPQPTGYRAFLIRTRAGSEDAVARLLQIGLRANGLTVTSTRERVANYQAVIGAYLSTFQLLGGLGLLLGVLGLAVVILRGVWERVGELALLRAVGYRPGTLQFLVLVEHVFLLVWGLLAGVAAAAASVAPHVAGGARVPWTNLATLLGLALGLGLVVAACATAGILRVPLIPALRRE